MIFGPNRSAISHIDDIDVVVVCHYQISTTSWFAVNHFLSSLELWVTLVNIVAICDFASFKYCLLNIHREILLQNDVVVKVFFQVFCTLISTMTIINCKYLNFWPVLFCNLVVLAFWLNDVQDNGNSIFICLSYQTSMGVCSKGLNYPKFLVWSFWILKARQKRANSNLELVVLVARLINVNFRICHTLRWFVATTWFLRHALIHVIFRGTWNWWHILFSLLASWVLFVINIMVLTLSLFMDISYRVHVTSLRLVYHFIWTLLLHLGIVVVFVFFVVVLVVWMTSFCRGWSLICWYRWVHGHLVWDSMHFVMWH